jgi:hypothetical protein
MTSEWAGRSNGSWIRQAIKPRAWRICADVTAIITAGRNDFVASIALAGVMTLESASRVLANP